MAWRCPTDASFVIPVGGLDGSPAGSQ
jgi:hypothetical protein